MIKNYLKLLFILFITVMVTSCEEESAEFTYTSPDGNNEVRITGSRFVSTDAFALKIDAFTGETPKGSATADLYADDLNESTVSITWENNSSCKLTLYNWDKTQQTVPITFGN